MGQMKLPTLYKLTSKGKTQIWEIEVNENVITVTHGQIDGKKQINAETIFSGKNVGKANATTPAQQAENEAQSEWTKKQERQGYVLSIGDLGAVKDDGGAVMLAQKYAEHADKMPEVCYAQPKFDGHRCKAVILNGVCTLYSRTNNIITGVPHINLFLASRFNDTVLDGELYNHDYRNKFEELTSFLRQETPKAGHEIVEYHIYDVIISPEFDGRTTPYEKRLEFLTKNRISLTNPLKFVETRKVTSAQEVEDCFRKDLNDGYEGTMLRDPSSVYKNGRSYGLQKVKEMMDEEFTVVAVNEGRGKLAGHAIFVCQVGDETFDCKKSGSFESLKYIFNNPQEFIGKELTVQFQGYTVKGKPRFPVGLRFREDV